MSHRDGHGGGSGGSSSRHRRSPTISDKMSIYTSVIAKDTVAVKKKATGISCDFVVQGKKVLTYAIERGDLATVRVLLDGGAALDLSWTDHSGRNETPLITAIRLSKMSVFEELLARGCQHQDPKALWAAVRERRYSMLEVLQRRGLDHVLAELAAVEHSHLLHRDLLKLLRLSLHLVVTADIDLRHWRVLLASKCSEEDSTRPGITVSARAARLLVAADCWTVATVSPENCVFCTPSLGELEPLSEDQLVLRSLQPPPTLKALCRTAVRRRLVALERYRWLGNQLSNDSNGGVTVGRLLGSVPKQLVDYIFLTKERQEINVDDSNSGVGVLKVIW